MQVVSKISQGSLYQDNGQVTTLDPMCVCIIQLLHALNTIPRVLHSIFPPPSQIYFCLLESVGKPAQQAGQTGVSLEASLKTSPNRGHSNRLYVVCFASLGKAGLDRYPFLQSHVCAHVCVHACVCVCVGGG